MEKRSLPSVLTDAVIICPAFQYIGSAHFVNQKFAELVLSNKPVFPLYRKDSTISTKTCRFRFRSNHLHTRALPQVSILISFPAAPRREEQQGKYSTPSPIPQVQISKLPKEQQRVPVFNIFIMMIGSSIPCCFCWGQMYSHSEQGHFLSEQRNFPSTRMNLHSSLSRKDHCNTLVFLFQLRLYKTY